MAMHPMTVPEHKLSINHKGHSKHLCELTAKRNMAQVAKLSKGAKFMCHICGRSAAKAENLCEPVKI